jgi:hypothetical protein
LLLLCSKKIAQPVQRVAGDDQCRRYGRLAHCDKSLSTDLLALGVVGLQDIVFALKSLAKREKSETSRVVIELASRFLDDRELFVDLREGRVTDGVEFCNVWVDVLVGLGEIWKDWLGKCLVTLVGKREGFLSKRILLEGGDRVAEQRVGSQVLREVSISNGSTSGSGGRLTHRDESGRWRIAIDGRCHCVFSCFDGSVGHKRVLWNWWNQQLASIEVSVMPCI